MLAFSRATAAETPPLVGIGMNFAAKAEVDADIESTLVHVLDDASPYQLVHYVWALRHAYRNMIAFHVEASARFRETGVLGEFPEGTFPPWAVLAAAS